MAEKRGIFWVFGQNLRDYWSYAFAPPKSHLNPRFLSGSLFKFIGELFYDAVSEGVGKHDNMVMAPVVTADIGYPVFFEP